MRDLLDHERQDARAAEAVTLFCYQAKKWIGSAAAALGGLTRSFSPEALAKMHCLHPLRASAKG